MLLCLVIILVSMEDGLVPNEFLKDLWHQKDEEPEGYDEWILLNYSALNYYSLSQVKYFKSWKEFVERAPIENWLYIDDLFQKEGGNHD